MLHNNTDMIHGMNTKTAQAVGVTAKFIGDIFAGRRRPSSSLAVRLESVTGIPAADWIFAEPCELRERLAAIYAKNGLVEGGCNAESFPVVRALIHNGLLINNSQVEQHINLYNDAPRCESKTDSRTVKLTATQKEALDKIVLSFLPVMEKMLRYEKAISNLLRDLP